MRILDDFDAREMHEGQLNKQWVPEKRESSTIVTILDDFKAREMHEGQIHKQWMPEK